MYYHKGGMSTMYLGEATHREIHGYITALLQDITVKSVVVYTDGYDSPDYIKVSSPTNHLEVRDAHNYGYIKEPTLRASISFYLKSIESSDKINCILSKPTNGQNSEVVYIRDTPNNPKRPKYPRTHPVSIFMDMYSRTEDAGEHLKHMSNDQ